jgi:hypothetical protein
MINRGCTDGRVIAPHRCTHKGRRRQEWAPEARKYAHLMRESVRPQRRLRTVPNGPAHASAPVLSGTLPPLTGARAGRAVAPRRAISRTAIARDGRPRSGPVPATPGPSPWQHRHLPGRRAVGAIAMSESASREAGEGAEGAPAESPNGSRRRTSDLVRTHPGGSRRRHRSHGCSSRPAKARDKPVHSSTNVCSNKEGFTACS